MLTGAAAQRELAADFSPGRIYSATELEQYAACPFRYFLAKVLKLEAVEELGLEAGFPPARPPDARTDGRVPSPGQPAAGGPASPATLPPDEYEELVNAALDEVLGEKGDRVPPGCHLPERPEGGHRACTVVAQMGTVPCFRNRAQSKTPCAKWTAACCAGGWLDYPISSQRMTPSGRSASRPAAGIFRGLLRPAAPRGGSALDRRTAGTRLHGAGDPHRRTHRSHRIGQRGRRNVFNVLDYKTGGSTRFSVEAVQRGLALQLPLYAMAVSRSSWPTAIASPGRPAIGIWPTMAFDPGRRWSCTTRPRAAWSRRSREKLREQMAQDGRRPRARHERRASSPCPARTRMHRPLPVRVRLPHQANPILGEDMAAAANND